QSPNRANASCDPFLIETVSVARPLGRAGIIRLTPLLTRGLLKHPREEPKPNDQANGVDDDRDVDAVPVRILAFFNASCWFIHQSSLFRKFRTNLQYPTPIQPSSAVVSASFCLSEKTSRLRTGRRITTAITARTRNHHWRESVLCWRGSRGAPALKLWMLSPMTLARSGNRSPTKSNKTTARMRIITQLFH